MNDYFADAAGYDAGKEEWQGVDDFIMIKSIKDVGSNLIVPNC